MINFVFLIWSILASSHPSLNTHPNRISNCKQFLKELNIQGFDFANGFKCSDFHKFNEINNLSIHIFELNFHQDLNKRRPKSIPIETSENNSDKVIDLTFYKNHYVLKKKLDVFWKIITKNLFVEKV